MKRLLGWVYCVLVDRLREELEFVFENPTTFLIREFWAGKVVPESFGAGKEVSLES